MYILFIFFIILQNICHLVGLEFYRDALKFYNLKKERNNLKY